jgi:hypothetical protein
MTMNRIVLTGLALVFASHSAAVTTTAQPPGTGNVPPVIQREAAKAMADDSSGLRRGTVERIDIAGGTFHVFGQPLTFDIQQVRVFDRGGRGSTIYALKPGTQVRFTLDARDPSHRRVSVIHVD